MHPISKLNENPNTYRFVVSNELNRLLYAENKLFDILRADRNLEKSVVISFKNDTPKRLACYLSGLNKRNCTVGIAGETACGKSTITSEIENLGENFSQDKLITRIKIDNYYYDRSKEVISAGGFDEFVKNYDLDVPKAFELDLFARHITKLSKGEQVYLPKYDMSGTAKRFDNHTLASPSKIILTEGLFTFSEKTKGIFDFKIYVDISEEEQKQRWYKRAAKRSLGESADRVYNNALEKAKIYIRPTRAEADIILNGEAQKEDIQNFIKQILDLAKELRSENIEFVPELV